MPRAYTPETLAERWDCSPSVIRKLCRKGDLPSFRLGGKLLRIRADDVEEYECQSGASPDSEDNLPSHGMSEATTDEKSGVVTLSKHRTKPRRIAAPRLDTRNSPARQVQQ